MCRRFVELHFSTAAAIARSLALRNLSDSESSESRWTSPSSNPRPGDSRRLSTG